MYWFLVQRMGYTSVLVPLKPSALSGGQLADAPPVLYHGLVVLALAHVCHEGKAHPRHILSNVAAPQLENRLLVSCFYRLPKRLVELRGFLEVVPGVLLVLGVQIIM